MTETQRIQTKPCNEVRSLSIAQISHRKKIVILTVFSAIATSYFSFSLYLFKITPLSISFVAIGLTICLICLNAYKKLSSASVKGDTIIIKNIQDQNYLAPIQNVRNMRTRKIGRTIYTSLEFKLDGTKRKALLLSDPADKEKPQLIIRKLQREIKNKKANL